MRQPKPPCVKKGGRFKANISNYSHDFVLTACTTREQTFVYATHTCMQERSKKYDNLIARMLLNANEQMFLLRRCHFGRAGCCVKAFANNCCYNSLSAKRCHSPATRVSQNLAAQCRFNVAGAWNFGNMWPQLLSLGLSPSAEPGLQIPSLGSPKNLKQQNSWTHLSYFSCCAWSERLVPLAQRDGWRLSEPGANTAKGLGHVGRVKSSRYFWSWYLGQLA